MLLVDLLKQGLYIIRRPDIYFVDRYAELPFGVFAL